MEITSPADTAIQAETPPASPTGSPQPRRPQKPAWLRAVETLASLRLTVVLFVLSGILVFFGTWAQRDSGIWEVMRGYFRNWIAMIPVKVLTFYSLPVDWSINHVRIPFPGGTLLGFLLLFNLLAAHLVRFKLSLKRSGIIILHAGIIIMMLGEYFTGLFANERMMVISLGETVGHLQDNRDLELAIVTPADAERKKDDVFVAYLPKMEKGNVIEAEHLPFKLKILEFHKNCDFGEVPAGQGSSTRGYGATLKFKPEAEIAGANPDQKVDDPYVIAELIDKDGKSHGTYALSFVTGAYFGPEKIKISEKTYEVSLRPKRQYLDFTVTLTKAEERKHPGTQMAKDFSSWATLNDPKNNVQDREVHIYMNNPLRYEGMTFFQANMGSRAGVPYTGLQVVRNWAWQFPYWSCAIVALGMLIHFGTTFVDFLDSQSRAAKAAAMRA